MLQFIILSIFLLNISYSRSKSTAKDLESQLYEDLLFYYNKVPRPVKNSSDIMTVEVGASLIRIIDVDEKNQVLTTNLWLDMKWRDAKLSWDPAKYGNLKTLHIPSDYIWTPDLVLYNNAAGDPDITILTDALVTHEGLVFWQPPAIYKSFCPIDVTWFPYDSQNCVMKFGTWTYTGRYVDLRQLPKEDVQLIERDGAEVEFMEIGMDLSFFYRSAEWDLLSLTSERHSVLYASCCGPEKYVDITYYFGLRRKTLFFTCNLIGPFFLISILTTFVFYLSDHKITFSISILVTLTVFFLVLIDLMPPTSLVIPMFGRYLITTMILVALSTVISVITVNFRFRSGSVHEMSPGIRLIFLNLLPRLLRMSRPEKKQNIGSSTNLVDPTSLVSERYHQPRSSVDVPKPSSSRLALPVTSTPYADKYTARSGLTNSFTAINEKTKYNVFSEKNSGSTHVHLAPTAVFKRTKNENSYMNDALFVNLLRKVRFIAEFFKQNERETEISDDWTFVAMVLDRLFLIIFAILNVGTMFIILEAPSLYDDREPMNYTIPKRPLGQANIFNSDSKLR